MPEPVSDTLRTAVYEIGTHAGAQAVETMFRLCGNLPGGRSAALAVAMGYIQHKIDGVRTMGDAKTQHAFNTIIDGVREAMNKQHADLLRDVNSGMPTDELVRKHKIDREELARFGL